MKIMKNNKLGQSLAGITLSLSLLVSGTMLFQPQAAHAAAASSTVSSAILAKSIIAAGEELIGTPYLYGSDENQTNTFDCSLFTQYVYMQNGISLPRSSKQQSQVGDYVPRSQLKPGDLVFFYSPVHHVAIYIGNGQILHTYGSPGVTVSDLDSGWWSDHYETARRVLPE